MAVMTNGWGPALQALLREKGKTQQELAAAMEMDASQLSRELRAIEPPTGPKLDLFVQGASALQLDIKRDELVALGGPLPGVAVIVDVDGCLVGDDARVPSIASFVTMGNQRGELRRRDAVVTSTKDPRVRQVLDQLKQEGFRVEEASTREFQPSGPVMRAVLGALREGCDAFVLCGVDNSFAPFVKGLSDTLGKPGQVVVATAEPGIEAAATWTGVSTILKINLIEAVRDRGSYTKEQLRNLVRFMLEDAPREGAFSFTYLQNRRDTWLGPSAEEDEARQILAATVRDDVLRQFSTPDGKHRVTELNLGHKDVKHVLELDTNPVPDA